MNDHIHYDEDFLRSFIKALQKNLGKTKKYIDGEQPLNFRGISGICYNTANCFMFDPKDPNSQDNIKEYQYKDFRNTMDDFIKIVISKHTDLYSDDYQYPIKSLTNGQSPEELYTQFDDKYDSHYGKVRMQLIQHIIDEVEARLK